MNKKSELLYSRAQKIYQILKKVYPEAHCSLNFINPFQLLIATILSAQCTDDRVNIVTSNLFKKYSSIRDVAKAQLNKFESDIRSTGFYRSKAKNIIETSKILLSKFNGKVPDKMEDLLTLPGVARKTANVVLGNAFGITAGIVVDTHVNRLSHRMGLTRQKSAEKIESDITKLFKKDQWIQIAHLMIYHGRKVCTSRQPKCGICAVDKYCPKFF